MESGGDSSEATTEGESALSSLLNLYCSSQGIHSIYLFDQRGEVSTNDEVRYISFQEFEEDSWYRRMEAGNLDFYMSPIRFDKNTIISVFLPVSDPTSGKFEGIVILNLFEKNVYDIYRNMNTIK